MRLFVPVLLAILLTSCTTMPKPESFFQLTPSSARYKALQSRIIESSKEKELLSASAAVLQDLGFQIEESVIDAGMLRAVKERSAREYSQEIGRFFVFILGIFAQTAIIIPVDLHQQIAATLVMHPIENSTSRFNVRIVFYRTLWKGDGSSGNQSIPPGQQSMEMIYDPQIYQQFFAKLSKSVFLEIHQI
ncbi:MAG: hypothetical protein KAQ91_09395 [Methylococcales bacterium]|nr:hypothetical protein [Methylococcales bacterium]